MKCQKVILILARCDLSMCRRNKILGQALFYIAHGIYKVGISNQLKKERDRLIAAHKN